MRTTVKSVFTTFLVLCLVFDLSTYIRTKTEKCGKGEARIILYSVIGEFIFLILSCIILWYIGGKEERKHDSSYHTIEKIVQSCFLLLKGLSVVLSIYRLLFKDTTSGCESIKLYDTNYTMLAIFALLILLIFGVRHALTQSPQTILQVHHQPYQDSANRFSHDRFQDEPSPSARENPRTPHRGFQPFEAGSSQPPLIYQ